MAELDSKNIMKIVERVAKLEERMNVSLEFIKQELEEIKDNHLHTLSEDVGDLKLKVNTLTVKLGLIFAVVTIVVDIIIQVLFRIYFP